MIVYSADTFSFSLVKKKEENFSYHYLLCIQRGCFAISRLSLMFCFGTSQSRTRGLHRAAPPAQKAKPWPWAAHVLWHRNFEAHSWPFLLAPGQPRTFIPHSFVHDFFPGEKCPFQPIFNFTFCRLTHLSRISRLHNDLAKNKAGKQNGIGGVGIRVSFN